MSRSNKVLAVDPVPPVVDPVPPVVDPIAVDTAVRDSVTLLGEIAGRATGDGESLLSKLRAMPRPDYFDIFTTRTDGSQSKAWVDSLACSYFVGYAAGMVAAGNDAESDIVRACRLGTSSAKTLGLPKGKDDARTAAVNSMKAGWTMAAQRAGLLAGKPKSGAAGSTSAESAGAEPATISETLPATITSKVDAVTLQGFHWIASDPSVQARFRQWLGAQADYAALCGI
jgi:hypothetical protein